MRNRGGFSIIELVIAVSLASFVLVGVATIAAQMARNQVDGIRSGTVTGWSLISYLSMAKEIEDSNVLAYPIADGAADDTLIVCKNWTRVTGAKLNTNATPAGADFVSVIQYCVDNTDPTNRVMRRFANVGAAVTCPNPGVPVACTGTPPGTWVEGGGGGSGVSVIGFKLEKITGFPSVFTRDNSIGGVRVRYVIGRQVGTANDPNPKSTPFDIGIAMSKQYNSTVD